MTKIISAHQPNFIPYLGFFDKMAQSDILVIRDEVLFTKSDWHHRNSIRVNSEDNVNNPRSKWLTVPVQDPYDYILHVPIKRDVKEKNKSWNQIMIQDIKNQYQKTPFFSEVFPELEQIMNNTDEKLVTLNMKIIFWLANRFGIQTRIVMASELGLKPEHYVPSQDKSEASRDLANICKALGGDVYLSGAGGREYLDLAPFEEAGIEVRYQDYHHPTYQQAFPGFLPNMCAFDALFCLGKFPETPEEQLLIRNMNISQIILPGSA
mgnify:CR=1 FL=1